MRIVALRGRGLRSLAKDFKIEFLKDPLKNAGLFAIVGPNGAGKTTLLDAITLALFGKYPRTEAPEGLRRRLVEDEDIAPTDPRRIINTRSREAVAEIEFMVGGCTYKATWKVARSKTGRLLDAVHELSDLTEGRVVAQGREEVPQKIQRLIGLDYNQFVRSVLLPQGDFALFLKSSLAERRVLLEAVAGLYVFRRLVEVAKDRKKEWEDRINLIENEIEDLKQHLLKEDEKKERISALQQFEEEKKKITERLDLLRQWHGWYVQYQKLKDELNRVQEDFMKTQEEMRDVKRLEEEAIRVERAIRLSHLIDRFERACDKVKDNEQRLAEASMLFEQSSLDVEKYQRIMEEKKVLLGKIESMWQEKEGEIEEADRLDKEMAEVTGRFQESKRKVKEASEKLLDEEKEFQRINERLEKAKKELDVIVLSPDMESLSKAFAKIKVEISDLITVQKKISQLQQDMDIWANRIKDIQDKLSSKIKEREDLYKKKEEVDSRFENAFLADIRRYRPLLLKAGQPCPLCGSIQHPFEGHQEEESQVSQVEQVRKAKLKIEEEIRKIEEKVNEYETESATISTQMDESKKTLGDLLKRRDELRDSIHKDITGRFEKAFEEMSDNIEVFLDKLRREIEVYEKDKERSEKIKIEIERLSSSSATIAQHLNEKREVLRQANLLCELNKADLYRIQNKRRGIFNGRNLRDVLNEKERTIKEVRDELEKAKNQYDNARMAKEKYQTAIESARIAFEETKREKEASWVELKNRLLLEGMEIDECKNLISKGQEFVVRVRDRAREIENAYSKAFALYERIAHDLENHEKGRPKLELGDVESELNQLEKRKEVLIQNIEEIKVELRKDEEWAKEVEEQKKLLDETKRLGRPWVALGNLIGQGNRFSDFVQSLVLDHLVYVANQVLLRLCPRFMLTTLTQKGQIDLRIVDRAMGDAQRLPSSLSGGEMFLVSLALALSLARISARAPSEILFIDEGFGSLDAEHMDIALGALDELRSEGWTVGFISHIQGIEEKVPCVIKVIPEGGGFSRVEVQSKLGYTI